MDGQIIKIFIALALATPVSFCYLLYGNNVIEISRFLISTKNFLRGQSELRIVVISDHGKQFGQQNRRLNRAIARLEPDLILVSGDMIDSDNHPDRPAGKHFPGLVGGAGHAVA